MLRRLATGALLGLALLPGLCSAQLNAAAKAEIDTLLRAVATSGCEFLRGESVYSAVQARAHLNGKYEYLAERDKMVSTEDFIDKAATRSSMTGEPYAIRCAGAAPQKSDEWMRAKLKVMRRTPSSPSSAPLLPPR